jgi:aspartyl-tRNA(Asn)/glutamyl-tRNA(Gln) amidotransferase subunit B
VKDIISANPGVVEDYKKGKENALQFLIGQTMAKSKGKANPQTVKELLHNILTES